GTVARRGSSIVADPSGFLVCHAPGSGAGPARRHAKPTSATRPRRNSNAFQVGSIDGLLLNGRGRRRTMGRQRASTRARRCTAFEQARAQRAPEVRTHAVGNFLHADAAPAYARVRSRTLPAGRTRA